jgi:hypothetical protein
MFCVLNWRFGAYHLQICRNPFRLRLQFNRYHARGGAGRLNPAWRWFEAYDESVEG